MSHAVGANRIDLDKVAWVPSKQEDTCGRCYLAALVAAALDVTAVHRLHTNTCSQQYHMNGQRSCEKAEAIRMCYGDDSDGLQTDTMTRGQPLYL